MPLVFDHKAEIYNRYGINFSTLSHLDSIGLIQFDSIDSFAWTDLPKRVELHYYDQLLSLEMPKNVENRLDIGKTYLTKIGQELAPISGSKPVDGFYEYVKDRWKQYLPEVKNAEQKA